jgi:two-component system OmpR family sensor kinase
MTAFFTLATALSLTVFAVITATNDAESRTREASKDLVATSDVLLRTADWDQATERFSFGRLGVQSWDTVTDHFAFVDNHGIVVASPDQAGLPSDRTIADLVDRAHRTAAVASTDAPDVGHGDTYRWVAQSFPDAAEPVVLVGAPSAPLVAAHERLVRSLVLTAISLTVGGAVLGHLLSGLAMRPALRGIAQQEQFLREAAHELRTPLATMQLGVDAVPDAEAPAALRRMSEQVQRMADLTNHLLARARLRTPDGSAVALSPLRLDQLVERTLEELPDRDDVEHVTAPTVVDGQPELIAELVRNLVENAFRHGAPPVRIVVTDRVLRVSDGGAGIPSARRTHVLRPGGSTGSGTGTGLVIVAWVARVHHADLRLATAATHGLEVTVSFPPVRDRELRP